MLQTYIGHIKFWCETINEIMRAGPHVRSQ